MVHENDRNPTTTTRYTWQPSWRTALKTKYWSRRRRASGAALANFLLRCLLPDAVLQPQCRRRLLLTLLRRPSAGGVRDSPATAELALNGKRRGLLRGPRRGPPLRHLGRSGAATERALDGKRCRGLRAPSLHGGDGGALTSVALDDQRCVALRTRPRDVDAALRHRRLSALPSPPVLNCLRRSGFRCETPLLVERALTSAPALSRVVASAALPDLAAR